MPGNPALMMQGGSVSAALDLIIRENESRASGRVVDISADILRASNAAAIKQHVDWMRGALINEAPRMTPRPPEKRADTEELYLRAELVAAGIISPSDSARIDAWIEAR